MPFAKGAKATPTYFRARTWALCAKWNSEMVNRKRLSWFLIIGMVVFIAGCATQPTPGAFDPPGFLMGIVHGFIMLFSFIGSIFLDVRMYAFPNSGVMYDFGYLIGIFLWLVFLAASG